MRIVVDGLALHGTSVSIVTKQLLAAWVRTFPDDEIHLVVAPDADVDVPDKVVQHVLPVGRRRTVGRVWRQTVAVPQICRRVRADVLLAPVPSTTISPLPCPRVLIHHDLQHELRPENFSLPLRVVRGLAYSISFRQADAVSCISARSRDDLLRSRPWLALREIRVVHHGSDHVEALRSERVPGDYAIAFGQYRNKNVDLLLRAWQLLLERGRAMPLHIVGLADRTEVAAAARRLGLQDNVVPLPWLDAEMFQHEFACARLVVFLSDYEGFGLPTVEAMRLGIPVVITPEPAVLEATSGHAVQAAGWEPGDVADAVEFALGLDADDLARAQRYAETLNWSRSVSELRNLLSATIARAQLPRRA